MSLLDLHLASLTLRGFRPYTVQQRQGRLLAFATTLAPRTLADATRADVELWLGRPLAPESRRAYRSHLRAFYRWCVEEGHLDADPTERVRPIRVPRGVPRPVSDTELGTALRLADRRMRCWLLLMALAGLRCMEVAALEPRDLLEMNTGPVLHLRVTKGGRPAVVPAHALVVEALRAQPIRNGLWWSVTPATVSATTNRHLRACGVGGSAHALRHYAATTWYAQSGHDLLTTAVLMRHARVDTTAVYARIADERPAKVVRGAQLRAV